MSFLLLAASLGGCDANTSTAPRPAFGTGPNGKNAPVHITPASDTIDALGGTAQFAAGAEVTWSSLSPEVVTVDGNGTATGVARGLGLIRALGIGGKKADTATVLVRQVPAVVRASPDSVRLIGPASSFPGQTAQLTATVEDANGNSIVDAVVTWVSDMVSVAVVSAEGLVSSVSTGVTTVRVILDQLSDTTVVNVIAAPST
jgi:hypothetical protein